MLFALALFQGMVNARARVRVPPSSPQSPSFALESHQAMVSPSSTGGIVSSHLPSFLRRAV